MALANDGEKLYQAVKSGRVKLTDLNDQGKQALRDYMGVQSTPAPAKPKTNVGGFRRIDAQAYKTPAAPAPPPIITNRYTGPNKTLQKVQGGVDFVNRLGQKTADTLLLTDRTKLGGQYTPVATPTQEKVTDIGGAILGSIAPIGGIYKGLDRAANIIPAARRLTPLAQAGVKGGIAGGTYETAVGVGHGETPKEIAKRAAIGTAAGALGDVVIGKAPQIIKALRGVRQKPLPVPQPSVKPIQTPKTTRSGGQVATFKPDSKGAEKALQMQLSESALGENMFRGDATKLRDLSGYRLNFSDVYRNFRDVFGKQYPVIKQRLLDPFDEAKKANVEYQEKILTDLKKNVVNRLGIKKGSKESALVQMYGEEQISLDELKKRSPKKWQNIIEADKWFRQQYDTLLDQVNAVRAQIYPTNPEKLVPKRKDYYRHFRELSEGFAALKNVFDTPSQIDPRLEGISDFTLPKTKWQSFAQKRLGGRFTNDAVGGFIEYTPAASYSVHIDPFIGQFERLAKELAENTADSRNANNFIRFLNQFSQDLAGKTNPMDRWFQENVPGGRVTYNALNWLNNRVKANLILGNFASALSQTANVPVGIAKLKQYSAPGAGRALATIFKSSKPMQKSGFLKERYGSYGSKLYRQFNTGLLSKPYNLAVWMLESADKLGTTFIWNSAYSKALAENVKNPVKYADDITRELVAGRGVGEVALNQKAKTFQFVAPFQVEVANLWSVMRDMVNAKDFGGLLILAVGNHLFNKAMEETRGSGVVFDPIQAMIDATEEDLTPTQRAGRIGGEVLSNVPLGQTAAALYPEYGVTAYGKKLPTREELFGRNDPTRYGSSVLIAKGVQDPLAKIVAPFAGNQIKKTYEGRKALQEQGVYSKSGEQLQFPVDTTPANYAKGYAFGKWSFPESRDYFEQDRRPLSEKQTKQVAASKDKKKTYERIQVQRKINNIKDKINEIKKDRKMTTAEKRKEIAKLRKEWKQIDGRK